MEKPGPDFLRAYADALETRESLENVDEVRRMAALDQHMLLALSRSRNIWADRIDTITSNDITEWLRSRLIRVTTPDDQSAKLGAFLTNHAPLSYRPTLIIGVFPLYHNRVHYTIRPSNPAIYDQYDRQGNKIDTYVRLDSTDDEDPLLVQNLVGGPNFLFYRQSPFEPGNPYETFGLPDEGRYWLPDLRPFELELEQNVIRRTLWLVNVGKIRSRPTFFKRTGIASFLNSHSSDPRYTELQAAFTQWRPK